MAEDAATPDLVELVRRSVEVANAGEMDEIMAFYATDAVWDMSSLGMARSRGRRRFAACSRTGSSHTRSGDNS